MKHMKQVLFALCFALVLTMNIGCSNRINEPSSSTNESKTTSVETIENSEPENVDRLQYFGDNVIDETDFKVFEQHFYGKWVDKKGIAPEDVTLCYSDSSFKFYRNLLDIYTESGWAYLVYTEVGEQNIYAIDLNEPDTMYKYSETNHSGVPRNNPDFVYTKNAVDEDGSLGYFGILKLHFIDDIPMDLLYGNVLETADNAVWQNFGEKLTIIEQNDDKITFKALCRAEGDNPYSLEIPEEPLKSVDILYTISYANGEWLFDNCEYASE